MLAKRPHAKAFDAFALRTLSALFGLLLLALLNTGCAVVEAPFAIANTVLEAPFKVGQTIVDAPGEAMFGRSRAEARREALGRTIERMRDSSTGSGATWVATSDGDAVRGTGNEPRVSAPDEHGVRYTVDEHGNVLAIAPGRDSSITRPDVSSPGRSISIPTE